MAGEVVSHRILSGVLGRIVRVEGATAIRVRRVRARPTSRTPA